ncbi:universal stress protein [Ideonella sp. DXS29W]|uniref:Universal stress protein n=1 Tax=Ideonella lacteola TaxID=2984193 RepID=A0ABU9BZ68_9BURK
MFKHILLPTDGSRLSEIAIFNGIELARQHGARVTGLHAMPEFHLLSYRAAALDESRDHFAQDAQAHAERHLEFIRRIADEARVECATVAELSDHPHDAIVKAARRLSCDLILMASHGRRGLISTLLGSETQRVLAHSEVPVMVWRAPASAG